MRVIAGEFRSRRLKSISGLDVRPTPDRLREALFNILAPQIEGVTFLDAYAGTGAVGIEALSRGARRTTFIERSRPAVNILRDNLATLQADSRAEVITGKAASVLARRRADIVFLDPPYDQEAEYSSSLQALTDNPPPLVLAQHHTKTRLPDRVGPLVRYRILTQGDNSISFYRPGSLPELLPPE